MKKIFGFVGPHLPEPYQSLAREQKTGDSSYLGTENCFKWDQTPQGWKFWDEVCRGGKPEIPEKPDNEVLIEGMDGTVLAEPYLSLAQKRRTGNSKCLSSSDCFCWDDTPEGWKFWSDVDYLLNPEIPKGKENA